MINALTLARMAEDCYEPCRSPRMLGKWTRNDKESGEQDNFYACAYRLKDSGITVVAFRGTQDWRDAIVEDVCGIGLSLNSLSLKLEKAIEFTSMMQFASKDLWLTGHSLGGAYVQLVAAILNIPGMTFNSPGALNLLNQMSPRLQSKIAGSIGGGVLDVMTRGVVTLLNKITADEHAFAAVVNYRHALDPVSLIGAHIGQPVQTLKSSVIKPHPHSISALIASLEKQ